MARAKMSPQQILNLAASLPLAGHVVSWRMSGVEISRSDLEALLKKHQFEWAMPKKPPTLKGAFSRALEAWIKAKGAVKLVKGSGGDSDDDEDVAGSGTRERAMIRVSSPKGSAYTVFAIVGEVVDLKKLGFRYGTSMRFLLEKSSGAVICTTDSSGGADQVNREQAIVQDIAPFWTRFQMAYVSGDLSRIVRSIVESLDPLVLREGGGSYFVPETHRAQLDRLAALVDDLPLIGTRKPFLTMIPIPDVPAARQQLTRAAHASMLDDIEAARKDLERFLQQEAGTVKPETIAARIEGFKALRARADLYSGLLGMWVDDITQGLDGLTAAAKAVVTSDLMVASVDDDDEGVAATDGSGEGGPATVAPVADESVEGEVGGSMPPTTTAADSDGAPAAPVSPTPPRRRQGAIVNIATLQRAQRWVA